MYALRLKMYVCDVHPQTVPGGGVQRQTAGAVGHQDRDASSGDGKEFPHSHCIGNDKSTC